LLAIASKNNPEDVDQLFAEHPHMILKREHFSCIVVHWKSKSESLAAIARRLNIALEHMVFVDDNPVECEEVSRALPMVYTICLPQEPEKFPHALLEYGLFDTLSYSPEDRRRTELYESREQAEALRTQVGSLEDFYRSLEMSVVFSPLKQSTASRAAQLTQKTNQFNATTRRYTEAELEEKMRDPNWRVITVAVRDRFGDNGIVGVMITHKHQDVLDVDTFLLSCRVIGRLIESAMLAHLCKLAANSGLRQVRGHILPTPKNLPIRHLFANHGFYEVKNNASDGSTWVLLLSDHPVREPAWMAVAVDTQT
jgi:FkbH-like protein